MRISTGIAGVVVAMGCIAWSIAVRPFFPVTAMMEPLLASIVVLALLQKQSSAWLIGMIGAIGIDLFRASPFPLLTLFIIIYLTVLQFLSTNLLTTRSFYSAFTILGIGRLLAWGALWLSDERLTLWPMPYGLHYSWWGIVIQLLLDALWVFFWYSVVSYRARRGPERYRQPTWS